MSTTVDPPNDNPGEPPGEGYTPPTGPYTKIAQIVTKPAYTATADQILAAGGPWETFTVKVTPINDAGSGTSQEVEYTIAGGDLDYDGGDAGTEV